LKNQQNKDSITPNSLRRWSFLLNEKDLHNQAIKILLAAGSKFKKRKVVEESAK